MPIALIDGDILIYKAACAAEVELRWEDGMWTYHAVEEEGQKIFKDKLEKILADTKCDSYIICLSDDKKNFRKHIYPEYKENRSKHRKPLLLVALQDYCRTGFPVCEYPWLEADDVMGILATSPDLEDETIIVTLDKDLMQIPAVVFNMDTKEFSKPEHRNCDLWFYSQILTGDTIDNYPGCPGVGPKTAERVLEGSVNPWAVVVDQYKKKKLTEKDALVQAKCAYILRAHNYSDTGQIKLWEPPNE